MKHFINEAKNISVFAAKLGHFIFNTFSYELQILKLNSKNWKTKKNKFYMIGYWLKGFTH